MAYRYDDRGNMVMSKYIKLEDAISKIVNTPTRVITDDLTAFADRQNEIIDMLTDLPTIEIADIETREFVKKLHPTWDSGYAVGFNDGRRSERARIEEGTGMVGSREER